MDESTILKEFTPLIARRVVSFPLKDSVNRRREDAATSTLRFLARMLRASK
jgi:hypothetical protein